MSIDNSVGEWCFEVSIVDPAKRAALKDRLEQLTDQLQDEILLEFPDAEFHWWA